MSGVPIDGEMFLCASRVLPKPKQRGMDKHSFAPCLPTSFWVFTRLSWTQTRCALSVFFRDAKFLLEAVGIFSWLKYS